MAKKQKMEDAPKHGVDAAELRRSVEEILRQKDNASEYSGLAGKATQMAIEKHSLDRRALGIIVSLKRADEQKRQTTLRSIFEYADKMGFFDQIDAFDDLLDTMKGIIDRASDQQNSAPADDNVVRAMFAQ